MEGGAGTLNSKERAEVPRVDATRGGWGARGTAGPSVLPGGRGTWASREGQGRLWRKVQEGVCQCLAWLELPWGQPLES